LPEVDERFDFDAFVRARLEDAERRVGAKDLTSVRTVLGELLAEDPINADARRMLAKVEVEQKAEAKLADAERLRAEGNGVAAIAAYRAISADSALAEPARKKAEAYEPEVVRGELERAREEAKKTKSLLRAHRRLVALLEIAPSNEEGRQLVWTVERKMRDKRIRFEPYAPPDLDGGRPPPSAAEVDEAIADLAGGAGLAKAIQLYRDGSLSEAIKKARAEEKKLKGKKKKKKADAVEKTLLALEEKYERVRTALGNDPAEAWAHYLDFTQAEGELLPPASPRTFARSSPRASPTPSPIKATCCSSRSGGRTPSASGARASRSSQTTRGSPRGSRSSSARPRSSRRRRSSRRSAVSRGSAISGVRSR